jgi:hypothetical protein
VIDEPYCRVCMAFAGAENNVRGEWKPVGFRRLSALGANAIPPSFVCPYCHKSVPLRFQRVIAVTSDWQPVEWACRRCELAMVPFPLWSYRLEENEPCPYESAYRSLAATPPPNVAPAPGVANDGA